MASAPIDSYKLLTTLKATGKDTNYSAEELANAFRVAQEGADLLTTAHFESRMAVVDERFNSIDERFKAIDERFKAVDARFEAIDRRFEAVDRRFEALEAKLDAFGAEIKAEVKSSQTQNLLWLSGIMLASNGATIAVLARAAHLF